MINSSNGFIIYFLLIIFNFFFVKTNEKSKSKIKMRGTLSFHMVKKREKGQHSNFQKENQSGEIR